MSDDELIDAIHKRYHWAFSRSAASDILAAVREHDIAALTAERERADRAEAALRELGKHPEECADDGGACVSHLAYEDCTAERDALREQMARRDSALRAIKTVAAQYDSPEWQIVFDCARIALEGK